MLYQKLPFIDQLSFNSFNSTHIKKNFFIHSFLVQITRRSLITCQCSAKYCTGIVPSENLGFGTISHRLKGLVFEFIGSNFSRVATVLKIIFRNVIISKQIKRCYK